jgi:hypothetical protein
MGLTRLPLTVEEAMRESGLEKFVDDEHVKWLLQLNTKEFYKHYYCVMRSSEKMLEWYSDINGESLSGDVKKRYDEMIDKARSDINRLEIVRKKRKEYQALVDKYS